MNVLILSVKYALELHIRAHVYVGCRGAGCGVVELGVGCCGAGCGVVELGVGCHGAGCGSS